MSVFQYFSSEYSPLQPSLHTITRRVRSSVFQRADSSCVPRMRPDAAATVFFSRFVQAACTTNGGWRASDARRRRQEQARGGAKRRHGGDTEEPGAGKETLCESCSDRVDRKTNPKAGTRRTLTWPERKRSGAQRMGAAASAGRSAGYGIGVVGGRGKAGTIEFGKSVITDDDAFQSSQRDPHRKSGKASSRSPRSGADDTKSSKVRKVLPRIHVRHASVCVCVFVSPPAVFDVRHSRSEHAYTRALVAHPAE